jgi:hypothetical protein
MLKRVAFLDAARAFAIILALFTHGMIIFSGWDDLPKLTYLRVVTRTATPLFILLFGIMLEIVYVPRAEQSGIKPVARRLVIRAAQCYAAYAATVLAASVGGFMSLHESFLALLYLKHGQFGLILLYYTIVLVFAPALVWLRLRFPVSVFAGLIAVIWLVDWLVLDGLRALEPETFGPATGVIFGLGPTGLGPSVWHGLTVVAVGMILGGAIRGQQGLELREFNRMTTLMLVVAAGIILLVLTSHGLTGVVRGYLGGRFRQANYYGYYTIGIAASLLTLLVLSAIVPRGGLFGRSARLLAVGRYSLFTFTLGNVVLGLFPVAILPSLPARSGVLLTVIFLLVILNITILVDRFHPRPNRLTAWMRQLM